MNSTDQAIIRHRQSVSLTFVNPPSDETKQALRRYGFDYDPKSNQWFKSQKQASLIAESAVEGLISA